MKTKWNGVKMLSLNWNETIVFVSAGLGLAYLMMKSSEKLLH